MLQKKSIVISAFLLLFLLPLSSGEPEKISLESSYRYTYNRTTGHHSELFFSSSLDLNPHIFLEGGFSSDFKVLPHNFYLHAGIEGLPSFLLYGMTLIQREYPDYEIRETTVNPTVVLLAGTIMELELGVAMRILNSDRETLSFHPAYRLEFHILRRPVYKLSVSIANFDRFHVGNVTDIFFMISNGFSFSGKVELIFDAAISNTGQVAMASFYSAFSAELGLRYRL
ncbi:MAG: hypothetical protein JXR86_15465 [Spirochaetales bacterium]|nr:hypothetical protein [Spirochaetales bacterium]